MTDGIPYFPLDVCMDDQFELIEAEFGLKGFAVIVKLYQKIYGGFGYYCDWTRDVGVLFSKKIGWNYNSVSEIVNAAVRRGIFDSNLYEKYQILTSEECQKRYFSAVSRRKQVNAKPEYLLADAAQYLKNANISDENVSKNQKNAVKLKQSKVKKSKEKDSKAEERKEAAVSEPPDSAVLKTYEKYIGVTTPNICSSINGYLAEGVEPQLMIRLIEYACERGARSWKYIESSISGNLKDGIKTLDEYNRKEAERNLNASAAKGITNPHGIANYNDTNDIDYSELDDRLMDMLDETIK